MLSRVEPADRYPQVSIEAWGSGLPVLRWSTAIWWGLTNIAPQSSAPAEQLVLQALTGQNSFGDSNFKQWFLKASTNTDPGLALGQGSLQRHLYTGEQWVCLRSRPPAVFQEVIASCGLRPVVCDWTHLCFLHQCLCLSPTYELALQTGKVIEQMGKFHPELKLAYAVRGNKCEYK